MERKSEIGYIKFPLPSHYLDDRPKEDVLEEIIKEMASIPEDEPIVIDILHELREDIEIGETRTTLYRLMILAMVAFISQNRGCVGIKKGIEDIMVTPYGTMNLCFMVVGDKLTITSCFDGKFPKPNLNFGDQK